MDDKLFKQLLSQVAEWHIPETITSTKDGKPKKLRKRGRPSAEDKFLEQQEEIFLEQTGGVNETFPPQLLKLKNCPTVCEDCGKDCPNGRHAEKKLYQTGDKPNWRERCLTCQKSRNPFTGKFDLSFSEASFVWTDYLKERKGAYKTEGNKARGIIQNDLETITFYPENLQDNK